MSDALLITIASVPASDGWGFVGRVLVGEIEAYRTIRAFDTPSEALRHTSELMAGVVGALLAGQEWRAAQTEFGHTPLRTDLGFGLKARPAKSSLPTNDPAPS